MPPATLCMWRARIRRLPGGVPGLTLIGPMTVARGDSVVRVSIDGSTGEIGRATTRARAANGCRSALHGPV
ncbi:hypothetical protein SR39_29530 [Methylobacterium radiotolerans]|nr:hypothetical protein SR39_29530 [Methylobacterium radiotolerans]